LWLTRRGHLSLVKSVSMLNYVGFRVARTLTPTTAQNRSDFR